MNIEGIVQVDAVDSRTGELKYSKEFHNMVFDAFRVYYFFHHVASSYSPKIDMKDMVLYLSEYIGPVTQASYSAITTYALSTSVSPATITYSADGLQVLYTFATQVFAGVTPTRTLRCVGMRDNMTASSLYSGVIVTPSITHDAYTTIYLHYKVRVYMSVNDPMFGYEVLLRKDDTIGHSAMLSYFGNIITDTTPIRVGKAGYKKYYYISPLNRWAIESVDNTEAGAKLYLCFLPSGDASNYIKKGTTSIPQWWSGPYGGTYEMRNSCLGVGCIEDPHMSRVFAHLTSVSSQIFYDSAEADVPESDGTLISDVTECVYQPDPLVLDPPYNPDGLKYPSAFKMFFIDEGDTGVATYNLQEYVMPSPWVTTDGGIFGYTSYSGSVGIISGTYFHDIYVSANRDWRVYRVDNWYSPGFNPAYPIVGYQNLERAYLRTTVNKCCIDSYGFLFYTHSSGTVIYYADMNDSTQLTPLEITYFDVTVECPGVGITSIRGITLDEDMGWMWVATNVGFVKCDFAASGGPIFTLYDHTGLAPNFALYMTSVQNVIIYDMSNGRFVAERGTLTWTQNNTPGRVWHWTGDRDARYVDVSTAGSTTGVSNLSIDYDLGFIGVVRNSRCTEALGNSTGPYYGNCWATVIRIGDILTGLVTTYDCPQQFGSQHGYSCGIEGHQFWFLCSSTATYNASTGVAIKCRIDLNNMPGYTIVGTSYSNLEYYYVSGSTVYLYNISAGQFASANRSIVKGVITCCFKSYSKSTGGEGYYYKTQIGVDVGPIYWGWDDTISGGGDWVIGLIGNTYVKTTGVPTSPDILPHNIKITFVDGPGVGYSFRAGEYYGFAVNPHGLYIDNLQTVAVNIDMYGWHGNVVTRIITVPPGLVYTIPEVSGSIISEGRSIVKGAINSQDYVHDGLTAITSVPGYTVGVDYTRSGDKIDWSLGGAEPIVGSTYTVNYSFNNFINMVAWMGDSHVRVIFADTTKGLVINPPTLTWALSTYYAVGDMVVYTGSLPQPTCFKCIQAHTSSATFKPDDPVYGAGGTSPLWQFIYAPAAVNAPYDLSQVRFNYNGQITFYTGHESEANVEIRYAWLSRQVD